jgi:hypothetical protein
MLTRLFYHARDRIVNPTPNFDSWCEVEEVQPVPQPILLNEKNVDDAGIDDGASA